MLNCENWTRTCQKNFIRFNDSLLKIMKNAKSSFRSQDFYIFVLTFAHVGKRRDYKGKVNFKIYDVTTWLTNN